MEAPAHEASSSWSSPLAFGAALGLLAAVATTRPALAADLENGEAVFSGNCTACHAGGPAHAKFCGDPAAMLLKSIEILSIL